jgi:hypothetical protein
MARETLLRYFVDIRLSNETNNRKSVHVDACSRTGAIYQALLLVKAHGIKDIYAIVVREEAYPVSKRKRTKVIKAQGKSTTWKKDNLKAIESIKIGLEIHSKKP